MELSNLAHSGSILLTLLVATPTIGALSLFGLGEGRDSVARNVSIAFASIAFLLSIGLLAQFEVGVAGMQFVERRSWVPALGIEYILGVDGISIWLVVLTTFLSLLVLIASTSVKERVRPYVGLMLLLETGMLGTFLALDAVTFYVFYELMLIPMYFLIGVWGGARRIYAAIKFVLYTALGSILMLVAIVYLAYAHVEQFGSWSFFLGDWVKLSLSYYESLWLFAAFALAFCIKIPLFPFHTWLPDAHVEAPTGGSVILAGVLLKIGIYGLIRFGLPVFPEAVLTFAPWLGALGVAGIVYGALVAWVQSDMKKLVAYSSVSHLGFCVLGFAALSYQGLQGAMLQGLNHGISTGALFFLVGVLYDQKHTREISAYGGLATKVPVFACVFLVFTLSSIGLPLTNGFVGEFTILLAGFRYNPLYGVIAVSGVVLGAVYMLTLYRKVVFGPFQKEKNGDLNDLSLREGIVFAPLLALVFLVGIYPQPVLDRMGPSVERSLLYLQDAKGRYVEQQSEERPDAVQVAHHHPTTGDE